MPGSLRALIRAGFLVGAAAYLGIASGCEKADEQGAEERPSSLEHPNVVIIIIDALRPDRLGAYGFDAPTSPELDAYGRKGVRFARVIAQSTWTRPSIGSMLTSLHPRTLGIYKEKDEVLASQFVTLAEGMNDFSSRPEYLTNALYSWGLLLFFVAWLAPSAWQRRAQRMAVSSPSSRP